jgi:hypothetical protein
MKDILVTLGVEDVRAIAEEEDEKGMFIDKYDELWGLAKGLCILDQLEVLGVLEDAIDVHSNADESGESIDGEEDNVVDGSIEEEELEGPHAPGVPVEGEDFVTSMWSEMMWKRATLTVSRMRLQKTTTTMIERFDCLSSGLIMFDQWTLA